MKKRLFIAVDLSEDARRAVCLHIGKLASMSSEGRIGWTRPENLHLTLKFLGSVDAASEAEVSAAATAALSGLGGFRLQIAGTGVFPSPARAKVLWLGVNDATGRLSEAASRIDDCLVPIGFPREDRKFSPHLTIARLRQGGNGRDVALAHLGQPFGPIEFDVDRVILYESKLTPKGPVYHESRSYWLADERKG